MLQSKRNRETIRILDSLRRSGPTPSPNRKGAPQPDTTRNLGAEMAGTDETEVLPGGGDIPDAGIRASEMSTDSGTDSTDPDSGTGSGSLTQRLRRRRRGRILPVEE